MTSWIEIAEEVRKMNKEKEIKRDYVNTTLNVALIKMGAFGDIQQVELEGRVAFVYNNVVLVKEGTELYNMIYYYITEIFNPEFPRVGYHMIMCFIMSDLCDRYTNIVDLLSNTLTDISDYTDAVGNAMWEQA